MVHSLIELNPIYYDSVVKFLPGLQLDTVIAYSIIGKKQPGRIFVDDEVNPTAALFWHRYGAAVLTGDCNNETFNGGIKDLLFRRFEENQKKITISIADSKWKAQMEEMLQSNLLHYCDLEKSQTDIPEMSKNHIIEYTRLTHKFSRDKFSDYAEDMICEERYSLHRITYDVYHRINGRVVPASFWESAQEFLTSGAGYCLMDDDRVACAAFAAYIGNGQVDVGIETNPEYRRRGLGAVTAAAMVRYCLEHGYHPVWGCLQDNIGSALIAKKVGFEKKGAHPVYFSIA